MREIDPNALPTAFRKGDQVSFEARIREPALGVEGMAVREDGLVVMEQQARHADGGVGRDGILRLRGAVGEAEAFIGADALEARRGAVAQAEAFVDDGCEVGELFEGGERGAAAVWVGDGGKELRLKAE